MTKKTQPELKSPGDPALLYINRYPPVEKIRFDPMKVSTSKDPEIARLLTKIRKPVFEAEYKGQIDKKFLPIELSEFDDLVFTEVKGRVSVEPHAHPGTMFGFVVSGDLEINGTALTKGDFYLVPPGQPYGIESVEGYSLIASYNNSC